MLDFTFEIIDGNTINIRTLYGTEWFTFNLYNNHGNWTLHPFEGILLQNKEMCRLVVGELVKNKNFHVLCAKENIVMSSIRTSINLDPHTEERESVQSDRLSDAPDHLDDFIASHTMEEVLELEMNFVEERIQLYSGILQKMFLQHYGPGDPDFDKVQMLQRIYKEAHGKLTELCNPGDPRKRF